jgi:hypothetical protein
MKKQIILVHILVSSVLSMNAQVRVPNDGVSPIWFNNDKVGIGTTTLHQQFSITGGIGFANQNSIDKKLFSPIDGTLEWFTHDWAGEHAFAVSHQGERRVFLNTNGNSYFLGGNVGIGTNNPSDKLSVSAGAITVGFGNMDKATLQGGSGFGSLLRLFYADGTETVRLDAGGGGGTSWINSGNLLIGKTSQINSAYKLDVNGTIRSNEIKVNLDGADFVFEEKYPLMPLSELETYIKKNKHLPEIAPAKEMQEQGSNLGDLNTKLLQKIEELTLYVIEQQKLITQQAKELESHKVMLSKIDQMEKTLAKMSTANEK